MEVGFLTGSVSRESGGVFDAVRGLAHALSATERVFVRVIGLADSSTEADRHYWGSLPLDVFPSFGPVNFGYAPGMGRILRKLNLDLVHTHGLWMYKSVLARGWASRARKPYLITPHGMLDAWTLKNSRAKKTLANLLFEKTHLSGAACLHALCMAEAHAIRALGLRNPVCVLPNGIDTPVTPPQVPPPWTLVPGGDRKVLLYLGRIHPKKGLLGLIKGWAMSQQAPPARDWVLAIAGWDQGGYELDLKSLVSELSLAGSVLFLGPQFGEAKAAAYHKCSAFILPSLSEGLPMVILEAWAHSKPVLISPQCNLPDGISAGAGLPIDATPESIARGLEVLFSLSHDELGDMGKRGLKLVEERFSWSVVAREMKQVYEWVLGGGTRPSSVMTK